MASVETGDVDRKTEAVITKHNFDIAFWIFFANFLTTVAALMTSSELVFNLARVSLVASIMNGMYRMLQYAPYRPRASE